MHQYTLTRNTLLYIAQSQFPRTAYRTYSHGKADTCRNVHIVLHTRLHQSQPHHGFDGKWKERAQKTWNNERKQLFVCMPCTAWCVCLGKLNLSMAPPTDGCTLYVNNAERIARVAIVVSRTWIFFFPHFFGKSFKFDNKCTAMTNGCGWRQSLPTIIEAFCVYSLSIFYRFIFTKKILVSLINSKPFDRLHCFLVDSFFIATSARISDVRRVLASTIKMSIQKDSRLGMRMMIIT